MLSTMGTTACDIVSGYDDIEARDRDALQSKHIWSQRYGNIRNQADMQVAVDPLGQIAVTGPYEGTINFGGGTLASAGATDVFVAKLDADGQHLWSHRFGDEDEQNAEMAGIDPSNGAVVVAGHFKGKIDILGTVLESSDGLDLFVAKFASNGDLVWARSYTGTEESNELRAATIDDAGNIYLTGLYLGDLSFVEEPTADDLLVSEGSYDVFVAKLDESGDHVWSRSFGDTGAQHGHNLAIDGDGNVIVTGHLQETTDFGGGALTSAGNDDIFVLKLDSDGAHVWSRVFGDDQEQAPWGVAVDSGNNIYLTGFFHGDISFGGAKLESGVASTQDVFVVKLAPDGSHVWSMSAGEDFDEVAWDIAAYDGGVVLVGSFFSAIDFGGGALDASRDDAFVARLDHDGNHLASGRWGSGQETAALSVGVDGEGNAVVGGFFNGSVDFGGGPLTSKGFADAFLVKVAP